MVDRGWVHVPVVVMFIRNGDDDGRESFEFVALRSLSMESQAFRWEESELPSLGRGGYRLGRRALGEDEKIFTGPQNLCISGMVRKQ